MSISNQSDNQTDNYWKDFDSLPKPKEVPYKYIQKLPRKKVERKRLNGHTCAECEAYYAKTGTVNLSSRHRGPARPKTPEHFWELDFPSEEECIRRGYITFGGPYKFETSKDFDQPIKNNKKYRIIEIAGFDDE